MAYYFGNVSNLSLNFLGPIHIIAILITIASILLIYKFREKLKKYKKLKYIFPTILLLNMIIFVGGGIIGGEFNYKYHIPIEYCYITGFIFMFMMFFNKEKLYNFLYYSIFFCTISVIIFQDTYVAYDRYQFIVMFITHHFLLISSFYCLYVLEYKVNKKGILQAIIYSLVTYSVVYIINIILKTNYIFKDELPKFMYEILPFLNNTIPFIWIALFSIPMLYLAYLVIKLNNKRIK